MIIKLFSLPLLVNLLLFVCIITSIPIALAYQCEQTKPFSEELETASAIFSGEIIRIIDLKPVYDVIRIVPDSPKPSHLVQFKVKQVWKGSVGEIAQVSVDTIGGSGYGFCDVHLKIGETYLVYAFGDALSTNICSRGVGICDRTQLLANDSEDLALLVEGKILSTKTQEPKLESPEQKNFVPSILVLGLIVIIAAFVILNRVHTSRK